MRPWPAAAHPPQWFFLDMRRRDQADG
jgi:hypothetical protein